MNEYNAIIVGGGPIGAYVAGKIAENKFKVAILEKNKETGVPMNCAGLITPRVFELLEIKKEPIIENRIKGANIHSPSGKILKIGGDRIHALAINRSRFDKELIKKAETHGVKLFLENNVLSAQKIKEHIEIKTSIGIQINIVTTSDTDE